jgi:hypothetical protein
MPAITEARASLIKYRWAVARRDSVLVQQIWDELTEDGRSALAVLLADAITEVPG